MRQRLGAEGEPGGIKRRRRHAERHESTAQVELACSAGNMSKCPSTISRPAQASASAEANATTRRDAESAASSGTTTSQIAAKDSMPPVDHGHRHDEARQRQRRQHMGALVAAGARQEPRQQDRSDQPGERGHLQRGRRAAHRKIDRECRQCCEAAEQPRRHEGAMARPRQRIVSGRRMQQRIETIADDTQNCHGSRASACSSNRRAETPPYRCPNLSE